MPSDWIQDRDAVIDPEANTSQQQSHSLKSSQKTRRPRRVAQIFHDDNLCDEQPPHLADPTSISREHLM